VHTTLGAGVAYSSIGITVNFLRPVAGRDGQQQLPYHRYRGVAAGAARAAGSGAS